jgi:hypothetical protein
MDLDDAEFREMTRALNQALAPFLRRGSREGRTQRLLATVLIPVDEQAEE